MSCFDRVVVTSSNLNQCDLFKLELQHLRETKPGNLGLSPQSEIFSVSDPLGIRVGSGGATFHAMAECYESGKSLLILHSGGDSRRNPLCCVSGKGFASLNFAQDSSSCPLERLLTQVSQLFPEKRGVLVCCTDTLMTNLVQTANVKTPKCFADDAVTGIGIYTPWDFGMRHGVFYSTGSDRAPFGILQKATEQELRATPNCVNEHDEVLLDSGLIHFGSAVADSVMLAMKQDLQFRGLTNDGMDCGLIPAKFELYTDFLQSLQAMSGDSEPFTTCFQRFTFQVMACDKQCEFIHLGTTKEHLEFVSSTEPKIPLEPISRSYCSNTEVNAVLINSLVDASKGGVLGDGALLEHCELSGSFCVGKQAILSQVRSGNSNITVEDKMCVQRIDVDPAKLVQRLHQSVLPYQQQQTMYCCYSVFGIEDGVKEVFPQGKYCNRSWEEWSVEITQCLWSANETNKSMWTAKLFPVLPIEEDNVESALWLMRGNTDANTFERWRNAVRVSLSDLVWIANVQAQFTWNRITLPRHILTRQLEQALEQRSAYPQFNFSALGVDTQLFDALDNIQFQDDSINARTMSLIADLLCYKRTSGNACHPNFTPALAMLAASSSQSIERKQAVSLLAAIRNTPYWQQHPMRVARHYDMASQLLTGKSLQTTTSDEPIFPLPNAAKLSTRRWVHATAPCRIDLSGGWTDTPPITNEAGGLVCNVAVNLEPNVHSLGSSCRRFNVPSATFHLRFGRFDDDEDDTSGCRCTTTQDFADHGNPQARCALLKCVLLALFPLHSLLEFNFGVELCIWSNLPAGSGLGGSSILAACALLACSRALGLNLTHNEICQLVLKVEQLLSTGGGWQDQVGSSYPGFKLTSCKPTLPLELQVFPLTVDDEQQNWFEQRGVLVQTGPARLARDLLQVVVRRWHRREPEFYNAVHELKSNALSMTSSLLLGDSLGVEREINKYWELKKQVCGAQQAEPKEITRLFEAVQEMVVAKMLCGAGGGGFAFFLLRNGASFEGFAQVVAKQFPEMKTFPVSVCKRGLCAWEEDV